MNFRKELELIRKVKREEVTTKAELYIMEASRRLRELPSFRADDKIQIFNSVSVIVMQNTNGSPIYEIELENSCERKAVFDAICEKLKADGCKFEFKPIDSPWITIEN